jgi:hypothetical protein
MANFIKQGSSSPELTSMIQCLNFLRVPRMSDIVTGCGSRILPRTQNGEEPESDATTQWPTQLRPPKGAWTIWKKCLGFMMTSQTTLALSQPLGKWKELPPGPLGNTMSLPTVCIYSIANEQHNITGFEEPQDVVETDDFFKQSKSMNHHLTRLIQ